MALRDRLAAAASAERLEIKARAHAGLPSFAGRTFTRGQFTITVLAGPEYVVMANGVPAIRLSLQFTRAGVDVTPSDFNPWFIVNPPILVPDPTGDVTIGDGLFREDPAAALAEIVRDKARTVFE